MVRPDHAISLRAEFFFRHLPQPHIIGFTNHKASAGKRRQNTMRLKILAMAAIVMGMALATAVAADVTGKWISEIEGRGGETMTSTYTFKVEGTNLTGTVSSPMGGENPISEGKIDGDNISFVVKMEAMGNEMTIKYKGTVSDGEIKLTMEMERGGKPLNMGGPGAKPMEFTLKRAE
jgi:hypothetical protein